LVTGNSRQGKRRECPPGATTGKTLVEIGEKSSEELEYRPGTRTTRAHSVSAT
jgi:hypothetical protein